MNKIFIEEGEVSLSQLDNSVKISCASKNDFMNVKSIKLNVLKNTDIKIESECNSEVKIEFFINISAGVKCNIYELKKGKKVKISYKYYLDEFSDLNVFQINNIDDVLEMPIFNLNGEGASVKFNIKTICNGSEKYDVLVYHNAPKTVSKIVNEGVNVKNGVLKFDVSGFVPNGIKGCDVNQNNRIINLTNNTCLIKPNLFIDENDVIANHSAHIGKCNDEEIFYLMSRGIPYKKAETLIIKGFLSKNADIMTKDIENIMNKYWR